MIISKTAKVKIHCNTAKYYESKGYKIPKHKVNYDEDEHITRGEEIEVLVSDLTPMSQALVLWQCPICKETKLRKFNNCRIHCNACALKLNEVEKKYCIDCGKVIQKGATRCKLCSLKLIDKKKKEHIKHCIDCGKQIVKAAKRCVKCHHMWSTGSNNHMFNPNLTEQDRQDQRYFPRIGMWRKQVLKRDNFICQCCGKIGKLHNNKLEDQLNAHHINSFKENKDLRTDVNNGITLCFICHTKLHKKYGKKTTNNELTLFIEEYEKWKI